jgi:hypothetical protein
MSPEDVSWIWPEPMSFLVVFQSVSHAICEQSGARRSKQGEMRPQEVAEKGSREMARYLISFDDGAMTFPEEELPDVAEAAHTVVQEAKDSGVWVFGGGLHSREEVSVVGTDGTVTNGQYLEGKAYIGGFAVVDVPSRGSTP